VDAGELEALEPFGSIEVAFSVLMMKAGISYKRI
jgi:hypothetical protein